MSNLQLLSETQRNNHESAGEFAEYVDVTNEASFRQHAGPSQEKKELHFIEAGNTKITSFQHLKNECIVPVFTKDNELTVSHPAFIETAYQAAQYLFPNERINMPEIMVSHLIKGRTPEAVNKRADQLQPGDETVYYERMAFSFEIPTIYTDIAGNRVNLCITGVRAYNRENLYNRKTVERFSVAIGFRNTVCCNLCIFTDGYMSDMRAMNQQDLFKSIVELFSRYNANKHLGLIAGFQKYSLTEHQFAQFLGKSRMYQCLPQKEKRLLPNLEITDSQINTIARNYYTDKNFAKRKTESSISMWNVYNLITGANKSSYIDNYLDRSLNAAQLATGLTKAIQGDNEYEWFIK